jgi:nitrogen fixation protein FixH
VKFFCLILLCLTGLVLLADPEGNFKISFEPTAKLQTDVEVPFEVHVKDALNKPLLQNTRVKLSIAPQNRATIQSVKAWFVSPGVFIAKPTFPSDGQWEITVTAHREDKTSQRTILFTVTD